MAERKQIRCGARGPGVLRCKRARGPVSAVRTVGWREAIREIATLLVFSDSSTCCASTTCLPRRSSHSFFSLLPTVFTMPRLVHSLALLSLGYRATRIALRWLCLLTELQVSSSTWIWRPLDASSYSHCHSHGD